MANKGEGHGAESREHRFRTDDRAAWARAKSVQEGAKSEATSRALLVIVVGGMCEERSDEQKVLLLKRGGTLFSSSLRSSLHIAFAVATLQPWL